MTKLEDIKNILSSIYVGEKGLEKISIEEQSGSQVIVIETIDKEAKKFLPDKINGHEIIIKYIEANENIEGEEDMGKKKTKKNPFITLAKYFPYSTKLDLLDEDLPLLVDALKEDIRNFIADKKNNTEQMYNRRAANQLRYLFEDHGVKYAADYAESLFKIKDIKLGVEFYQAVKTQQILKAIQDSETQTSSFALEDQTFDY